MIIDLRDYTTTVAGRDLLIERCEGLLWKEQERLGATFLGAFRDADAADRLVWLRGMPDLPTRERVMTAFYADGDLWRAQRTEVNSWLVDSDNVLLMRPRGAPVRASTGDTVVGMYSHLGRQPLPDEAAAALHEAVAAAVHAAGGRMLLTLATDPAENNYPRHPIRTGEHGLVWFASYPAPRSTTIATDFPLAQRRLIPTANSGMR